MSLTLLIIEKQLLTYIIPLNISSIDWAKKRTKYWPLILGLQPFTTYSFRVAAQNNIGYSLPSKESFQTQTHRESE